MSQLQPVVDRLARKTYMDVAASEGIDLAYSHPSQSRLCHVLTLAFWNALHDEGIEARREVHQTGEGGKWWHTVIAHTAIGSEPSPDDTITDLNGWLFDKRWSEWRGSGQLHGTRDEVKRALGKAGCGSLALVLHDVETITKAHTLEPMPVDTTAFPGYR